MLTRLLHRFEKMKKATKDKLTYQPELRGEPIATAASSTAFET
jgi:hypothetical protein